MHLGLETLDLDQLLMKSLAVENQLRQRSEKQVESRGKFRKAIRPEGAKVPQYYMFLDECGTHAVAPIDRNFPVFALCGIIVDAEKYHEFDVKWKNWKIGALGIDDPKIHEPDLRKYSKRFRRNTDDERSEVDTSLKSLLEGLDFHCIAAVVDLAAFGSLHPTGRVDDFLPQSCYLMAIDFVMERFVHFLQRFGQDARGHVFAESRGPKEDVLVNYEYVRLQKEGTQFISESDFRYQLRPYIEFHRKSSNNSGLQVADIAARPLAEKVIDPGSNPKRWDVFMEKLYDGCKGEPFSYGLKVFPLTEANDPFQEDRSKKKEMHDASPSPD
jgi:hypothetical protein